MDYLLQSATDQQAEQICSVWGAGWHEAHAKIVPAELRELRTSESFKERLLKNLDRTCVATSDEAVLGFYIVKQNELYQMYVSTDARGSGVASGLISHAENRLSSEGYRKAWLACAVGNERAARFYEKTGWDNMGRRVVDLDTSKGTFSLEIWRFEKELSSTQV